MLTEKRLQRNRQWLLDERARLKGELDDIGSAMDAGERPGLGTHMADSATDVFEQTKNAAVQSRLRNTLALVERALEKLEKGTYGSCERCGQPIDPARLKALPQCALCMACQSRSELNSTSR